MQLPFLTKKQVTKEYFLALILSSGKISSILFEKAGADLLIVAKHATEFQELLDTLSSERLIELSDVVITEVEGRLPEGSMLEKTIFAVPQNWVQEGKIDKEHLGNLKRLCEALQLTPIGFIVSIEAIVAYLYKKEGVPVTALFVELGQKHATVTLVKSGNILSVHEAVIEEDSIATVEKLFATQTDVDVLPAKIILLNYEHAQKTQQAFLSHTWKKDLPFLHIPQVVVLDPEIESNAVISGVAQQMGFDNLAGTVPQPSAKEIRAEKEAVEQASAVPLEAAAEEVTPSVGESTQEPQKVAQEIEFQGEEVGFFKDVDVLKNPTAAQAAEPTGEDEETIQHAVEVNHHKDQLRPEEAAYNEESVHSNSSRFPIALPSFLMPNLKNFSTMLPSAMTKLPGGKSFLYPVIGLIIIVIGIIGYYFFFEKVQVQVTLDKKQISKDVEVEFSPDKDTSVSDNVIHITSKSIQVEGQDQKDVTGKKETGEKAKGEVTILSSQNKEQTIEKGTVLTSSNSLKFALDSDVKIASSSGLSDIKSVKGKITASEIGKEYNLPSGTKFTVAGFDTSSVEAKNDSALSGGSKKEIKVFSATDQSSLSTKVEENLAKKAVADFTAQKGTDENVLPIPLSSAFDEKDFSKKVGDEATSVSLTAKITYDLGVYNKADVVGFIKELSKGDTSSEYKYSDKDSTISVEDIALNDDGAPQGKLQFAATFLPQITTNELAGKLAGKSSKNVAEIIQDKGIANVNVVFLRSIPFFPQILPFNKNNIEISVTN